MNVRVAPVLIGILLACVGFGRLSAADDLETIGQMLSTSRILRAEFVQERHMAVLANPLTSEGRLTFDSEEGVLWRILQPFPVVLLLRRDEILEWTDTGEPHRLDIASSAMYVAVSSVFFSALSGTTEGLEEAFVAEPRIEGDSWSLVLVPRDAMLAAAIAQVELRGSRYVERVRIVEARGDETIIQFANFSEDPAALDSSERQYFEE